VLALDLKDGQLRELCNDACGFSYRTSIFNTSQRGRHIIVRATYALTPGGEPQILYADLKKHFSGWEAKPKLADVREAVRRIRASKGMLITPGDEDCRSAGSFFKNPVLSHEQLQALAQKAKAKGFEIPSYPALESQRKVSAAWLVEHSGFSKGFSSGRVGISSKHALAIVIVAKRALPTFWTSKNIFKTAFNRSGASGWSPNRCWLALKIHRALLPKKNS
jgi:UDP-N-acetylmuramate dehydrogenase